MTFDELDLGDDLVSLLDQAWGQWWHPAVEGVRFVLDEGPARVEFDDELPNGPVVCYLRKSPYDQSALVSRTSLVHEVGHLVHLKFWTYSRVWPDWTCETFAFTGAASILLNENLTVTSWQVRDEFDRYVKDMAGKPFASAMAKATEIVGRTKNRQEALNEIAGTFNG